MEGYLLRYFHLVRNQLMSMTDQVLNHPATPDELPLPEEAQHSARPVERHPPQANHQPPADPKALQRLEVAHREVSSQVEKLQPPPVKAVLILLHQA